MKKSFLHVMILALAVGTVPVSAQYDDIYYSSGATRSRPKPVSNQERYYGDERYNEQEGYSEEDYDAYDDEAYNYLDEYDYSYTHRIRRFHRPLIGRGFYDPFYWDPWYYDPYYYSRGFGFITPRIGIGFYSFNDFNRWNRWQRYNSFRYWDPWAYSYWSSDPFLFNRFNNFYWANNAWCPTSWYSNNYYINNNFWGNRYNGSYQPRYYTDNNAFFGPRRYGTTTTGDRGPSRSATRVFSEPTGNTIGQPLRRTTPRDVETTVVRERNVPINRNPPTGSEAPSGRISPRGNNETNRATQPEKPRSFRDFDDNNDYNQRNSPRINDNSNQERTRNLESPRRNEPVSAPQYQAPRTGGSGNEGSNRSGAVSPRNNDGVQSRQMEMAPRNHPYQETPTESTRMRLPRTESPGYSSPRTNNHPNSSIFRGSGNSGSSGNRTFDSPSRSGNSGFSGSSSSGGSGRSGGSAPQSSGGGGRTSPRNQ